MLPDAITDLPISEVLDQIRETLAFRHQVVLQAPPGAGKTTAVPLALLQQPWLREQKILMLEPRRVAARAAATRMAEMPGGNYEFENGHSMDWGFMPNGDDRPLGFQRARVEQQFGADRSRWMIDHVRNLVVYPNVLFMDQSSSTESIKEKETPSMNRSLAKLTILIERDS